METKWIVKSRAFLALLGPMLAWGFAEFGAPAGMDDVIARSMEWILAGLGLVAYVLHWLRPDGAQATLLPPTNDGQ
jgi:hypothetical protein